MSNKYSEMSTKELNRLLSRMNDGIDNPYQYGQIAQELNRRWEELKNRLLETSNPDIQLQKDAIDRDVGLINYIPNLSEEMKRYAIDTDPNAVKYIQDLSEELQVCAVRIAPDVIQYFDNPSEPVQIAAVLQNGDTIKYIKTPTYAAKVLAVSQSGDNIKSIKRADETLQIIAAQNTPETIIGNAKTSKTAQLVVVHQDGLMLEYIKNPDANIQRAAIDNDINALKFVTDAQVRADGIRQLHKYITGIVREAFNELNGKRFFVSEADFQHALATALREELSQDAAQIHLEFPIIYNGRLIYTDIMIEMVGCLFPIELKYKTKCIDKCCQPYEETGIPIKDILKDQGAQDLGGYYFWKDINRIETLVSKGQVIGGVCIFITNDQYYWAGKCVEGTQAYAFRLTTGTHARGKYDWNVKDTKNVGKYIVDNPGFDINNDYVFQWQSFYEMVPKNGKFMYLFIEIPYAE